MTDLSGERIKKLQTYMLQAGVDLVAIAPTANMRYLLGFAPLADERPCFLLVGPQATQLVIPEVNAQQVESHTGRKVQRWSDALGPDRVLDQALTELEIKAQGVLAVDDSMRADAFLLLQKVVQPRQSIAAGDLMTELRVCKSAAELELMAQAAALADEAILAGAEACQPGVSEREVASRISTFFRDNGAESVDFTLVASGPNSAFPHHEIGGRRLQPGDTIILDIGATLNGYKSDITRVVQLGEPPAEVQKVHDLVREANQQGRQAAVAGATARQVDQATRRVIEEAGYGQYFFHRTGHGLGMEIHEPPWITAESETVLKPGMVFSVEPGIYLSGQFGIRIEDIVAVTEGECRR
jgi:Xaa-Pro aminopeptidase